MIRHLDLTQDAIEESLATPGNYAVDLPGTAHLDRFATLLRRVAEMHGHRARIVVGGATIYVDVYEADEVAA